VNKVYPSESSKILHVLLLGALINTQARIKNGIAKKKPIIGNTTLATNAKKRMNGSITKPSVLSVIFSYIHEDLFIGHSPFFNHYCIKFNIQGQKLAVMVGFYGLIITTNTEISMAQGHFYRPQIRSQPRVRARLRRSGHDQQQIT
jgi:hypothetical protein